MTGESKPKEQLIRELADAQQYIAKLERAAKTQSDSARRALWASENRFRTIAETAGVAIIIFDARENIFYWNKHAHKIFGYTQGETRSNLLASILSMESQRVFKEAIVSDGDSPLFGQTVEAVGQRKSGATFPLEVALSTWNDGGETVFFTVVARDISEQKAGQKELARQAEKLAQANEILRQLSLIDDLTGLYNRRGFYELAGHLLELAARKKWTVSLLYADVDDLKGINDHWGHSEGDRALTRIAQFLIATLRSSDIVARFGGDEFVLLAVETDEYGSDALVRRLQAGLAEESSKDSRYQLSLSIGISQWTPESPCSLKDLLSQADELMYKQK